jgi:hypothetical protein
MTHDEFKNLTVGNVITDTFNDENYLVTAVNGDQITIIGTVTLTEYRSFGWKLHSPDVTKTISESKLAKYSKLDKYIYPDPPDMVIGATATEQQKAACKSRGTNLCAAICMSNPTNLPSESCQYAHKVWTDHAIRLEIERRPDGPLAFV